jgi:thioredoxin 1
MTTFDVNKSDFDDKILKSTLPVLVDFWAPWCGPCKLAEPVLEELSEVYKDKISIAKVNVDENQELAEKYDVMSIPTTVLFKEGKEVERQTGYSGRTTFEDLMKKGI